MHAKSALAFVHVRHVRGKEGECTTCDARPVTGARGRWRNMTAGEGC
jgi:hypothetical protein